MSDQPAEPKPSRLRRLRDRVVTADAVYGTILYAALIAVSAGGDEAGDGIPGDQSGIPGDQSGIDAHVEIAGVLLISITTLLVFWAAHVYARTIAGHGVRNGRDVAVGTALHQALEHSVGMLYSAIPATIILVLGAFGLIPDAADWALWVNVFVLGVLGYQALSERRRAIPIRILGAVITALLGLILIIVDIAVH